jgi:hypothetical protein
VKARLTVPHVLLDMHALTLILQTQSILALLDHIELWALPPPALPAVQDTIVLLRIKSLNYRAQEVIFLDLILQIVPPALLVMPVLTKWGHKYHVFKGVIRLVPKLNALPAPQAMLALQLIPI